VGLVEMAVGAPLPLEGEDGEEGGEREEEAVSSSTFFPRPFEETGVREAVPSGAVSFPILLF